MGYDWFQLKDARQEAFEHNLRVFERLCDFSGHRNVLVLGSNSGRFQGVYNDFALLPFEARGLRILLIAQKGDGKSFLQSSLFQQLNAFYGYSVLLNDLKNEFVKPFINRPLLNPLGVANLMRCGLKPMGFENVEVVVPAQNWSSEYENRAFKWRIELKDLAQISDAFDRRAFLLNLLDVDGASVAAQEWVDRTVIANPQLKTFKDFAIALNTVYEIIARRGSRDAQTLSASLRRKIETVVERAAYYSGESFDFFGALKSKKIVSLQGSVGIGMQSRVFQSYFAMPYFLVKEWRERKLIDKVCNIYEERDAIIRRGDNSLLARLSELNATKGRTLSNIDVFTIQDPSSIDDTEIQQFDYVFTTKPNNEATLKILSVRNGDQNCIKAAQALTKQGKLRQWLWATASEYGTFYALAPFAQLKEEASESRLKKIETIGLTSGVHAKAF